MRPRKVIKVDLSQSSVENAIKELKKYKLELAKKNREFIQAIESLGYTVLNSNVFSISHYYRGDDISVQSTHNTKGNSYVVSATISVRGEQCAFIEFGAGVTFNTNAGASLHPKGQELGMTIGSYNPSSKNATSPTGWFKPGGEHTYGVPTYAPLWKTREQIVSDLERIAIQIFSS